MLRANGFKLFWWIDEEIFSYIAKFYLSLIYQLQVTALIYGNFQ